MAATLTGMEFAEVVRARRMVRTYDPGRPVPPDVLLRALHTALRAPSAGFTQGWDFLVLVEPADRELFWRLSTDPAAPADRWSVWPATWTSSRADRWSSGPRIRSLPRSGTADCMVAAPPT